MDVRSTVDQSAIGFAGLASLVSTIPEPAPVMTAPSRARSEPRWPWAFMGIGVVTMLRLILGSSPHTAPTIPGPTPYIAPLNLPPSTFTTPGFTPPGFAPPSPRPQPSPPPVSLVPAFEPPTFISEVKPPPGTDLTLPASQILYCLAQKIRLDTMEPIVDTKSAAQLGGFNGLVDDYNLRCLSYHYRFADMAVAQRRAELLRAALTREAKTQLAAWH
jgi:hypothetical protein